MKKKREVSYDDFPSSLNIAKSVETLDKIISAWKEKIKMLWLFSHPIRSERREGRDGKLASADQGPLDIITSEPLITVMMKGGCRSQKT